MVFVLMTPAVTEVEGDNEGNGIFSLSYVEKHGCFVDTKRVTSNLNVRVHMTRTIQTRPAAGHEFLTETAIGLALFGMGKKTNSFYLQVIDR